MTSRQCCRVLAAITVATAGCAGLQLFPSLDSAVFSGNYSQGLADIEKSAKNYGEAAKVLYYMDKGSLLQMQGNYKKSNAALEEAEKIIARLYTKSLTAEIGALLTNDMVLAYAGEDFEQVMVHVLKCLNYLYLGDWSGAEVEARKVNHRLNLLSDQYGEKAVYSEDAFARYLSAFAYEAGDNPNDAYIDYKKSFQDYDKYKNMFGTERPSFLGEDIWRTGMTLGIPVEEMQNYLHDTNPALFQKPKEHKNKAEVLLVVYDGLSPYKISEEISVMIKDSADKPYLLKVAFPAMVERPVVVHQLDVLLENAVVGQSVVVEDLSRIAVVNLKQRIGFITAKTIARATAKFLAADQIKKQTHSDNKITNFLISMATNIFTVASEHADVRSWRELPGRFHLARVVVAPGTTSLGLRLHLSNGGSRDLPPVFLGTLKPGQKKVLPVYAFN